MQKIVRAVEKYRSLILEAERYLWEHPETGYREYKTTEYLANKFSELGYDLTMAEGITGFFTVIDTSRPGPEILILGELDSVICSSHEAADPTTGAVHSCGHHAQCAALLGVAAALKEPGMLDSLCGKIRLCAVPAEELLELEYRSELRKEGKIKYFSGKREFMSRGYFDGVDMAFMVHIANGNSFVITDGHVGSIAKSITYRGKASHAGNSPEDGINALYAATCGLNALNAIRETFRDSEQIRVHPIITSGGNAVNAIPDAVKLESYVRGVDFEAILDVNRRVNRAFVGAALSLGANIGIEDFLGYAPQINSSEFIDLAEAVFPEILPGRSYLRMNVCSSGSTDMGELCCIMPTLHPNAPGAIGAPHGSDYGISDPISACVDNAKWQIAILFGLLENGAECAKRIISSYSPKFKSASEYLSFVDSISDTGERIEYGKDTAKVRIDK